MSLLWAKVARWSDDDDYGLAPTDEEHHEHALHPVFQAAGIGPAPCMMSRCPEQDFEHSDTYDWAESLASDRGQRNLPVHHLDLTEPVHGFEFTADMHRLRHYIKHPSQDPPTVFRHRGQHYIMDGHHRVAAALLREDTSIPVHRVDLDTEEG